MFDKEFYPTPKALIEKLLKPYKTEKAEETRFSKYFGKYNMQGSLLEPSAGKGDILDYIKENTEREIETWKTNNAYKVNRKIIAPAYVKYGSYMGSHDLKIYGDKFSLGYNSWSNSKLSDLDKVLQYISGKSDNEVCTIQKAIEKQFDFIGKICTGDKFNSNCQSTFFDIKFYKKGTIHLKFRDEKLWKEFNFRACDGKNWLPNNEKKEWKNSNVKKETETTPTKKRTTKTKKVRKLNSDFSKQILELFG